MAELIERVSFVLKASANPPSKERVKMGEIVFRMLQHLEGTILKRMRLYPSRLPGRK